MRLCLKSNKQASISKDLLVKPEGDGLKSYEYTYGDRNDFEIAIIPIHLKEGFEHWMIGFYLRSANGDGVLTVYDPKKNPLQPWLRDTLRRVLNYLHPTKECKGRIMPAKENFNKQSDDDGSSCGIYICFYAKNYLMNNRKTRVENFSLETERHHIYNVIIEIAENEEDVVAVRMTPRNELRRIKEIRKHRKEVELQESAQKIEMRS